MTTRALRAKRPAGRPAEFRDEESGSLALVTLLGEAPEKIADKITRIEAKLTHFEALLFVVGPANLAELTRNGRHVEQMPGVLETHGRGADDIRSYLQTRMDILLSSWQPDIIFDYGLSLIDYADSLCDAETHIYLD